MLLLFGVAAAWAEPHLAVLEDATCGSCHVTPSGGGMRDRVGVTWAHTALPTFPRDEALPNEVVPRVRVGADFRLVDQLRLPARTEQNGLQREVDAANALLLEDTHLYLSLDAVPEHVVVVLDEAVGPDGGTTHEAFIGVHDLPLDAYARAGRIRLPYGLGLREDDAFVRQVGDLLGAEQELGAEVGIDTSFLTASFALTTPSPSEAPAPNARRLTSSVAGVTKHLRAGVSVSAQDNDRTDYPLKSVTVGGHAGGRLGPVALLTEADWTKGSGVPGEYSRWALYTEATVRAWQGLYPSVTYEAMDPVVEVKENERDRFGFGVSWHPLPAIELRAAYALNRDIPQHIDENADVLSVHLHGFL